MTNVFGWMAQQPEIKQETRTRFEIMYERFEQGVPYKKIAEELGFKVTQLEHQKRRWRQGKPPTTRGQKNLTEAQIDEIETKARGGQSIASIAKEMGIPQWKAYGAVRYYIRVPAKELKESKDKD